MRPKGTEGFWAVHDEKRETNNAGSGWSKYFDPEYVAGAEQFGD
jgi:hypothetical protein